MASGGKGSRQRRKLKRKEERKKVKTMRYAASMRREGVNVDVVSKNPDKKKRTNHRRGDPRTEIRRANAEARQLIRDSLSSGQQLDRLDIRLGRNVGAVRERARLGGT